MQSFGKLTIPRGGDAMTISAHKIGGPKGCGAVYINPAIRVPALTPGVTHERGLRGGGDFRYTFNCFLCSSG
ncbi:hypothetical protein OL548_31160 [Lysinibacillus sp. MHQ-1]|nr:hypothetical protein OL548_31160 [Lysinibacillus sp. MHQ-1]